MKGKNLNVEVLRGVLMIWIVLFHYTTRFNELFNCRPSSYEFEWGGQVGVTFFFILSGYFFYAGLLKMQNQSLFGITKFCVNKYWRLYPAYLISIIIIFLVYQFTYLPGRECSIKDFIINSVFIYHPGVSYVDSAHWFLATLIKIQIISSFFLAFKSSIRSYLILLFELAVICLLVCSSVFTPSFFTKIESVFSLDCFLKFLMGYNIYEILSSNSSSRVRYIHIFIALLAIGYYCYTINMVLVVIYSVLLFLVLQNKYIPFLNCSKPFVIIGKYSFVWYLIHQNLGFIILNQMNKWGINSELGILIPMLITFGLAVMIQSIVNFLPRKIFSN